MTRRVAPAPPTEAPGARRRALLPGSCPPATVALEAPQWETRLGQKSPRAVCRLADPWCGHVPQQRPASPVRPAAAPLDPRPIRFAGPEASKENEDERERQVPDDRRRRENHRRPRHLEPRLVAEPAESGHPAPARAGREPAGRRLRLRRGVQEARPGRAEAGPLRADDRLAGVVAGRLGPLRRPVHPHGLAQRRHLPHRRRPGRRRHRQPALRADQQLARQRQPRQGAPPALADQAEVRQPDLLGRPDDPGRQLRARVDGLPDLRLRRRPRRHLAARRGHLLGQGGRPGWATSATAASASSRTRWPPCRWG